MGFDFSSTRGDADKSRDLSTSYNGGSVSYGFNPKPMEIAIGGAVIIAAILLIVSVSKNG